MNLIDLHVHSTFSDGSFTPAELVHHALENNLRAIALTDHDSIDGIPEIMAAAKGTALEIVPGIEFSTDYLGKDVHIVGLDIDYTNTEFTAKLKQLCDSRHIRNLKMIDRLREGGIDISIEQMYADFGDAVLTRGHFARYLYAHGYISEMQEAFQKYVGDHCPYYVHREKASPAQAVSLIYENGGIPILAHPLLYHFSEAELHTLLSNLKEAGLMGVEAIYSTHSQKDENLVRHLARHHGLLISGGSDFHGKLKPHIDLGTGMGSLSIPYEVLSNLRERRKSS